MQNSVKFFSCREKSSPCCTSIYLTIIFNCLCSSLWPNLYFCAVFNSRTHENIKTVILHKKRELGAHWYPKIIIHIARKHYTIRIYLFTSHTYIGNFIIASQQGGRYLTSETWYYSVVLVSKYWKAQFYGHLFSLSNITVGSQLYVHT